MNSAGPIIGLAGVFVLNTVFNSIAPVTWGMRLEEESREAGVVQGRVFGWKIQECRVVRNSFVGWEKINGVWEEIDFRFINDPSPNSTRPSSWTPQDFGIWHWDGVSQEATDVMMTLQHVCNGKYRITKQSFSISELGA